MYQKGEKGAIWIKQKQKTKNINLNILGRSAFLYI
jgi:hypothetical protein